MRVQQNIEMVKDKTSGDIFIASYCNKPIPDFFLSILDCERKYCAKVLVKADKMRSRKNNHLNSYISQNTMHIKWYALGVNDYSVNWMHTVMFAGILLRVLFETCFITCAYPMNIFRLNILYIHVNLKFLTWDSRGTTQLQSQLTTLALWFGVLQWAAEWIWKQLDVYFSMEKKQTHPKRLHSTIHVIEAWTYFMIIKLLSELFWKITMFNLWITPLAQ